MRPIHLSVFLFFVWAAIFLFGCGTGEQEKKTYTIGIVNVNPIMIETVQGFKAGMAERGYAEGLNTVYIYGDRLPDNVDLREAAADLVKRKVDLIFVLNTPAASVTASVVQDTQIPVVFANVYDPIKSDLASNLRFPDRNITGITVGGGTAKALDWLCRISPRIKKVYVPVNEDPVAMLSLAELQEGAQKLKIVLLEQRANTLEELTTALAEIPTDADAIFILNCVFHAAYVNEFIAAAVRRQMPLAGEIGKVPISFGQNRFNTGKQASRQASDILRGVPVNRIPVEQADLFLRINLKTAKDCGVEISDEILKIADAIVR